MTPEQTDQLGPYLADAIAYCEDVVAGRIPAGRLTRLACERQLRDLAREPAPEFPFYFDLAAANRACARIESLPHIEGEWASRGECLRLERWQRFLVTTAFGWLRTDSGARRFRTTLWEVARKNGKSSLAAGIAVVLLEADRESGAQVYTAAPLALDTPIPTPSGWTTMGELREGDTVFDQHGRPTRVTYVSPVVEDRKCYELTFNDGERLVADSEHRWWTGAFSSGESLAGKKRHEFYNTRRGARTFSVRTTAQIAATCKYQGRANHVVPAAGPLHLPPVDLPIGPYTLGAWLGDGRCNRGSLVFHQDDSAIANAIEAEGYKISRHVEGCEDGLYRFTVLGLRTMLRGQGLIDNKHVPPAYLRASPQQRLALLRGLMDTDGTCTKSGECRFTNRNERLAAGVAELLRTLGIIPKCSTRVVTEAPHYIVSFKAPASCPVFKLARKARRQRLRRDPRSANRYIVAVRECASVPVRCISVASPDSLYLVGRSFVITHNTKRDQAKIVFGVAREMILRARARGDEWARRLTVHKNAVYADATASRFLALDAEGRRQDGLNIHGAINDELHAWKGRELYDVLETGMGARRQPLMVNITTAGNNMEGICYELRGYAVQILEGTVQDESFFPVIWTLDKDDDPFDDGNWPKANPNYGVSVYPLDMQRLARKAEAVPSQRAAFLTKRLNIWCNAADPWMDMRRYVACGEPKLRLDDFVGAECWLGADLASKRDMSCLSLLFRDDRAGEPHWYGFTRHYLPEYAVLNSPNAGVYDGWVRSGLITVTPGALLDVDRLEQDTDDFAKRFALREIAYDPGHNSTQFGVHMVERGLVAVEVRPTVLNFSDPMKWWEGWVISGQWHHDGDPCMAWQVSNVCVKRDQKDNIFPRKESEHRKIDGPVSMLMAINRGMAAAQGYTIYDQRGVVGV